MALKYKLKPKVMPNSPTNGHYYAYTAVVGELNTDAIAEIIQRNCSLKKSDVKAVIEELIDVIKDALQSSMRVRLDGLGTFTLAPRSTLAPTAEEFAAANITGYHVNFRPAYTRDIFGKHVVALLEGVTAEPYAPYVAGVSDKDLDSLARNLSGDGE